MVRPYTAKMRVSIDTDLQYAGYSLSCARRTESVTELTQASPVTFVLTADRDRAKPFYAGALGLPILHEDDFAVTFGLAGGATMRLTLLPGHTAGDHTVLGWGVPDIATSVAALKAKGVTFKVYNGFGQDENGVWTAPGGGAKVAWFGDPDGNVLSLTQFG
jgi:catechol 2,3-dioxygenase-like lactoylglutathione lyase family enzyme